MTGHATVDAGREGDAPPARGAQGLSRRQWLAAGVALVGGAGLAGCQRDDAQTEAPLKAFWALRLPAVYPAGSSAVPSATPGGESPGAARAWVQPAQTVASQPLPPELTLAAFRGRPLLVNFWATWCPPCLEEMPLISRYCAERRISHADQTERWQCLGLAVEARPEPVARFLARTPVSFPVALVGLAGVQISRDLGNVEGGLPFSLLLDAKGRIKYRKIGQLQPSDLSAWLG